MFRPGIVFLDADTLGDTSFNRLTRLGSLTVYKITSTNQRIEHIGNHEIVITNKVIIDREVMDACPSVKLICIAATGLNNIDLEYAAEKGISVRNVSAYSTESVVQHTFAMLFYLLENIIYYHNYVVKGEYAQNTLFTHHGKPFHELAGKNYGIIGMGTIGKRIAEVAMAYKAHISYYSTSGNNLKTGYTHVDLDTLLATSDIISLHCPLNEKTRNLIDYKGICKMKPGAIIINAGRGGIINESDLARALDESLIGGAALDVLGKEPPDASNPLLHLKEPGKLLITPHIAWASIESRERLVEGIALNITDYLANKMNS